MSESCQSLFMFDAGDVTPDETSLGPIPYCTSWVWCPCDVEDSWSYCSRSDTSSCSFEDICNDMCAGPGGWFKLCGDECLGPPCVEGRFYGEVAFICQCPSETGVDASMSSLTPPRVSEGGPLLCDDLPTPPFPVTLTPGDPDEYVPETLFIEVMDPVSDASDSKGAWTWCPCNHLEEEVSYPWPMAVEVILSDDATPTAAAGIYTVAGKTPDGKLYYSDGTYFLWYTDCLPDEPECCEWWLDTIEPGNPGMAVNAWFMGGATSDTCAEKCPLGTYTATGTHTGTAEVVAECPPDNTACGPGISGADGLWIFRGGNRALGPPSVVGRYNGETLFVGFCCEETESSSSSLLSSSSLRLSSESLSSYCSMPLYPDFWWQLAEEATAEGFDVVGPGIDDCLSGCSGYIWCPCEWDMSPSCRVEFPETSECLQEFETPLDTTPGEWLPYEGDGLAITPCIQGRFYGELVFMCQCPEAESSESCTCEPGGLQVAVNNDEDFYFLDGYYNPVGWSSGKMYYQGCPPNDNWYILFTPGLVTDDWDIRENPPSEAAGADGFTKTSAVASDPDPQGGTYNGYGAATGTATVTCCHDCATDCTADPPWPDPITLNISGLAGSCACMNGSWDLAHTDCYWDIQHWYTQPPACCVYFTAVLWCECGAWRLHLQGATIESGVAPVPGCGGENDSPVYVSEPNGIGTEPPPKIGWIMTATGLYGCTPGQPPPTVTLSY